jgi:hypothetical protein
MSTGSRFDKTTYEAARPYLQAALEHIVAAGRSMKDLAEFASDRFGDNIYPYLREFQQEVRSGRITVQGLKASAKISIFGKHTTPEERERMIREAAYLRAERRGFAGGSSEEDWAAAESEIDELLARETGLFEQGKKAMQSAKVTAEREIGNIREVVGAWLERTGREAEAPPKAQARAARSEKTARQPEKTAEEKSAKQPAPQDAAAKPSAAPPKRTPAASKTPSAAKAATSKGKPSAAATKPTKTAVTRKSGTAKPRAATSSKSARAPKAEATSGETSDTDASPAKAAPRPRRAPGPTSAQAKPQGQGV